MQGGRRSSSYYPISLNLVGKRCVVIGGGTVALRKVKGFLEHGASVEVISPDVCSELSKLTEARTISLKGRKYEPGDLDNAFIVIAATAESETNQEVANEARRRKILVNVVDSPEQSDFIVPAHLCRGDLTVAVATAGKSPALARKIRTRLEKNFGEEYASLTELVEEVRAELKQKAVRLSGNDWQNALDLDLLVELLRTGQREKAKTTLLGNLKALMLENH
ncbi:bifunctional precorrin-2 dehydrogenase/sirohydrochlorin ferrochelatase [Chloroflexota bacterium]